MALQDLLSWAVDHMMFYSQDSAGYPKGLAQGMSYGSIQIAREDSITQPKWHQQLTRVNIKGGWAEPRETIDVWMF